MKMSPALCKCQLLSWSLLTVVGCVAPLKAQSLSDANASSNTRGVYEYLKTVGAARSTQNLILGQHSGHGATITRASLSTNPTSALWDSRCFERYIQPIFDQTGKWPGILSLDYEWDYPRVFDGYNGNIDTSLKHPNLKLKEWWSQGGLVTINWSPANPWQSLANNTGNYSTIVPGKHLSELTDLNTDVGKYWQGRLDEMAHALLDLQDAGVVVLWRPFQEMNAPWFWPGYQNHSLAQGSQFIALWHHLYDYFTTTKGLHNLIWVFSPTVGITEPQVATTGDYGIYPGNAWVDLVAFTSYGSPLGFKDGVRVRHLAGTNALIAQGKPIALAETGPQTDNTTIDNVAYLDYAKSEFPTCCYVIPWQSFPSAGLIQYHAWVNNTNLVGAFADPRAIHRALLAHAAAAYIPHEPVPYLPTNLSLGKTVTVSQGTTPNAASDGNPATSWHSGLQPAANPTVMINLGSPKSITRVKLTWQSLPSKHPSFRIQISPDTTTWTDLTVQNYRASSLKDDLAFPPQRGQYVRLYVQGVPGNPYYGYQLCEFEIYEANPEIPLRPTGLQAVVTDATHACLTWKDNSANEKGFKVERKSGPTGVWGQIATVEANVTSYTDSGRTDPAPYRYRVRAYSASGDSGPTNDASTSPSAAPAPTPPAHSP